MISSNRIPTKHLCHLLLIACLAHAAEAQDVTHVTKVGNPPNTPAQQAKHYVIMVSLDGFRWDYPEKYGAPHLQAMAKDGASAPDGMLPSYPSLTFPNHLSLVTGLYPEHHGIVANSFYDPARKETYSYKDSKTNGDGSWYNGTPLWVLAEHQGMRSACLFWPGSEAAIRGQQPSYYLKYSGDLDDRKRVDQVLEWLQLPPEQRPHFITLYYPNVDHEGHEHGPDSDEVRASVHHVDEMIGDLQAGLADLKLPVDLIVVADHGMAKLDGQPIDLSTFAELSHVKVEGQLLYAKNDAAAEKLYNEFKAHADPRFSVYRRRDLPRELNFSSNPREGDPVIVANGPYLFHNGPLTLIGVHGEHGYNPYAMPEMKAIFFADGPDIKPGVQIAPFRNVDVYPFVAQLLGLIAPSVDGGIGILKPALVDPKDPASNPDQPRDVGKDVLPPKIIKMVEPEFSEEARAQKITGEVMIDLIVQPDGTPTHVHVTNVAGHGLDEQAVKAVKQYRFSPAKQNGVAVAVEIQVEIEFQIP